MTMSLVKITQLCKMLYDKIKNLKTVTFNCLVNKLLHYSRLFKNNTRNSPHS